MAEEVCPKCLGTGWYLVFYSRGPNSPPGNCRVECKECKIRNLRGKPFKAQFVISKQSIVVKLP